MSIIFQKPGGKLDNKESHRSSEYISVSVTAVFFLFFHKNTEKKIISKLKRHLPEDFQSLHFFFLVQLISWEDTKNLSS